MRGTKAKLLRKLAGGKKKGSVGYSPVEHTVRMKVHKDFMGIIVSQVQTATMIISPQTDTKARGLYQILKAGYKAGAMRPA